MNNAKKYNRTKLSLSLVETSLTVIFLLILVVTPLGKSIESLSINVSENSYVSFLIFIGIIGTATSILLLPINFYSGYILEHKYKLSNQTFIKWIWEEVKGLLVMMIIGVPLLLFFYHLLLNYSESWWLILAIFLFLFSVLFARLAPIFLFPIFYKFTPLDDEELKNRISSLCETVKIRFTGIFKFNLSKNTRKANAGFTGIGKTKRIILSDTLLNEFNYDEIETVFAHELGHYKLHHIIKLILVGLIFNFVGLYLSATIYEYFVFSLNYKSLSQLSALPLLSLIFMFYGFITMPLSNIISRKFEYEADEFAVQLVNKPQAFISTMEKLSKLNLTDKTPNPIIEFIFYSHPSIEKRIRKINKLQTNSVKNIVIENI